MTLLSVGVNLECRKIYISSSGRLAGRLLSNQGCGNTLLSEDLSHNTECSWHFEQPREDLPLHCVTLVHWSQTVRGPLLKQSMKQIEQILIFCRPCISIYLFININQLDALNFIISFFQASTCFEHHVLIVRRSKLYYTNFNILLTVHLNIFIY